MTWTVEILGTPAVQRWTVSELPQHPEEQDRAVAARFPRLALERERACGRHLRYIARPPGARPRGQGPELTLAAVSGPDAGQLVPLPRTGLTVGRGESRWRLSDPSAPSRPLRIRLGSAGIVADGAPLPSDEPTEAVRVGETALTVTRGPGETLAAAAAPPPPTADTTGAPASASLVLPAVMAVGPLTLGVVLAVSTGRAFFLLFGLLSVIAVATMLGLQHRSRVVFRRRLQDRLDTLLETREASAPTPASLSLACRAAATDRFGLCGTAADAAPAAAGLVLRWGTAVGAIPLDDPVRQERWAADTVRRQPALSLLGPDRRVTVTGVGPEHEGALRWLLVQLLLQTARHGLGLVVRADDEAEDWQCGAPGPAVVLTLPTLRPCLPVLQAWARHGGPVRRGPAAAAAATWAEVTVAVAASEMPHTGDVVDFAAGRARLASQDQDLTALTPCRVSAQTARWWAAEIAAEPACTADRGDPLAAPMPLRVPTEAGTASATASLRVPLARTPETESPGAPLDLVADGPHVLIAGTTGSGKSELLLSVLVGLCAHHPPAEVSLVLLDFKGGASFSCLEPLPHTMSVETNHVPAASLRALDAISAELHRREKLFADHRVSDYPGFRRARPDAVLPRLVVAVDELRVLLDAHPEASDVFRRLAATGRSLGFHLVLATQRATGTVTADIRSNLGSVLCLRTAGEQESWDLIGSADAARLDPDQPGSVIHAGQGRDPVRFRAATWVRSDAPARWVREGTAAAVSATATDWAEVVEEITSRCLASSPVLPPPVLSPALPEQWTPSSEPAGASPLIALVDDAASGRHQPLRWEPGGSGSSAWIIEPGGGRAAVLHRLRHDLVRSGERVLHLDGTGDAGDAPTGWTVFSAGAAPDLPGQVLDAVDELTAASGTLLITGWSSWAGLRCPETYRGLEELLLQRLASPSAASVRVAAVGGRDLGSSRLLGAVPRRFYVPAGTTPEQRALWPQLTEVLPVPGRAVLVDADHPAPGLPAHLPVLERPAGSSPGLG